MATEFVGLRRYHQQLTFGPKHIEAALGMLVAINFAGLPCLLRENATEPDVAHLFGAVSHDNEPVTTGLGRLLRLQKFAAQREGQHIGIADVQFHDATDVPDWHAVGQR